MSQNFTWPATITAPPVGAATAANQVLEIAELTAINSNTAGLLTDAELRASPVPVSAASLPLPTGAATAANQSTANASLASIDGKLTSPLAVTGPLTDTELRATAVPVSLTSTTITGSVAVIGPLTDAQLRATPVPVSGTVSTGGLTDAELRASAVPVSVSGVATAANQTAVIGTDGVAGATTALVVAGQTAGGVVQILETNTSGHLNIADGGGSITVDGPLTDAQLRATAVPISAASLPLPTGAATETTLSALSSKSASSFITVPFDETVTTYVGATERISTVVYKLATVTVATLTMSYDGSNRLTGVVRS